MSNRAVTFVPRFVLVFAALMFGAPAFAAQAAGHGHAAASTATDAAVSPTGEQKSQHGHQGKAKAKGKSKQEAEAGVDHASERAQEVAPPHGGTSPRDADAAHDGLGTAADKAADEAKAVAKPLGGDSSAAGREKPGH